MNRWLSRTLSIAISQLSQLPDGSCMIILVTDDPVQTESICIQLKQKGYPYSMVHDDTEALVAVKSIGISLLLIDTTCTSFDGFGLCKTVKTDEALRGLPVLLLTSLEDAAMLLKVLDSMADGFITIPVDPQTLLSTIDDLRKVTEREKPLPAVRTRFVVSQDGGDYSVVADRRQLLEFLLSTYELAVRIRREQELTKNEIGGRVKGLMDRLSAITSERDTTVRNLYDQLEEKNRTITRLTTTLQEKEKQESLLRTRSDTLSQELGEKEAALGEHRHLLEEKSVRIASLEGQCASSDERLNQEVEKNRKLTGDLDAATASLVAEKKSREELEGRLRAAMDEKDAQQREWKDRTSQVSRSLSEMETALGEHQRLLEEKSVRIASLEGQCASSDERLNQEVEKNRELTGDLDAATASLVAEKKSREELEGRLRAAMDEKDAQQREWKDRTSQMNRSLSEMETALAQAQERLVDEGVQKRVLKEQIATLIADRDRMASEHEAAITIHSSDAQKELEAQKSALEQEKKVRATTEAELAALRITYANAQQFLDSASRDIGVLNAALSEEREMRKKAEERLNTIISERGHPDPTTLAPADGRTGLNNEPGQKMMKPSASDQQSEEPSKEHTNPEAVLQKQNTLPPSAGTKEPEPLLPPSSLQMKLPEPEPSALLPEGLAQEPDEPVMEPPLQPRHEKEQAVPVQETMDAPTVPSPAPVKVPADWMVNRNLWFDMIKWVHHTVAIPPDQRKELLGSLMKHSRLVQQGRHLTSRQEESMRSLLGRLQALGYRFH
jgi:DNA-binding response OmpR family regulator